MKPPKLISLLVCWLGVFLTANSDLASDREALLALRTAVRGRTMGWNVTETNPCSWLGVKCESDRVTELRLPGRALVGKLPPGLGNLTQLLSLSLRVNALSGQLPNDLVNLVNLQKLYLQGNSFSGPIPEFLFKLKNLTRLNLDKNKFSGEISPGFNNLTRLVSLHLEENELTGSIPELGLSSLGQFNVSFNQLNGSVPAKLSGWPKNAFEGNLLCGKPLKPCNETESAGKKNKLAGGTIAGIVIGSIIGFLVIVAIVIFLCKRKKNGENGTNFVVCLWSTLAASASSSSVTYSARLLTGGCFLSCWSWRPSVFPRGGGRWRGMPRRRPPYGLWTSRASRSPSQNIRLYADDEPY